MSTRVRIDKVRLCWPELFEAKEFDGDGKPKFRAVLLIDKKDKAALATLKAAQSEAAEEGKSKVFGGKVPSNLKSIIHDGDDEAEQFPERAGHWRMSVSSNPKFRPGVVDKNVQPVLDQSEVYSGVYANVTLTAYAFDRNGNKGVTFGLNNVQVLGYGENLAGGVAASEEFDAVDVDEDDLI